ncbi:hypothetical protein CBS101457_002565 [Exobasidium rhododendri]|nr:hypothetical protein CBS101457_002565 [Exobasidium rhododendri]
MTVLQLVHEALLKENARQSSIPKLGVRDLQILQTTTSILANWKLAPLVFAFDSTIMTLQSPDFSGEALEKLQELPDDALLNERKQAAVQRLKLHIQNMDRTLGQLRLIVGIDGERSEISNALLHTCAPHFVALAVRLAMGPKVEKGDPRGEGIRRSSSFFLNNLLRSLSTSSCLRVLSATGHIASAPSKKEQPSHPIPSFAKSSTERLYSAQMLRTDGVMALLKITFGNGDDQGSSLLKKMIGVGHLLSSPPPNMPVGTFASLIAPRLMEVVGDLPHSSYKERQEHLLPSRQSTSTQKTAACFALARLHEVAPEAVDRILQQHVWNYLLPDEHRTSIGESTATYDEVHASIDLLYQLIEHSEPSTSFLSFLIAPVVVPLFTLHSFLKLNRGPTIAEIKGKDKASSSALLTMTWSILTTWTRLVDMQAAIDVLSPSRKRGLFGTSGTSVIAIEHKSEDHLHPYWKTEDSSRFCIAWRRSSAEGDDLATTLSTLNIADLQPLLQAEEENDTIPSSILSALNLTPSPILLSSLLKDASRKDVASEILSSLLQSYILAKQAERALSTSVVSSTDSVLFVQHILELLGAFGSEALSEQASKVLTFIDFALGSKAKSSAPSTIDGVVMGSDLPFLSANGRKGGAFDGLSSIGQKVREKSSSHLNVKEEEEEVEEEERDETDEELVETALNLLLSLLEGDPNMSMDTHTILRVVSSKLEVQASSAASSEVRALAKEARLVLTARQLSKMTQKAEDANTSGTSLQLAFENGNGMYQEALLLLQDPILPVRAHGLILLKELAGCGSTDTSKGRLMDPALTPAILDIYIQAIQNDESFLYLNAVKGIAEMANTGGGKMIRRIVSLYLGESSKSGVLKAQVDMQLRMGEALLQVVQKLEEALLPHIDEIVEPLLTALRDSQRSTTLRSSYLSVLGTCVEACPLAFSASRLGERIVDSMLDLLSVETAVRAPVGNQQRQDMEDPTHTDSKLPQLRRAAVLLLALFIRGSRHQLEVIQEKNWHEDKAKEQDGLTSLRLPGGGIIGGSVGRKATTTSKNNGPLLFSKSKVQRTSTVLSYLAQTDVDGLVRHQSNELLEELRLFTLATYAAA